MIAAQGIALFLFIVQVATGTLLALYYKPTPDAAYDSVLFMMRDVRFGWLIRSVHHWAANLMILFVVLHLLRVVFQAAYKYPRELTWLLGMGLQVRLELETETADIKTTVKIHGVAPRVAL